MDGNRREQGDTRGESQDNSQYQICMYITAFMCRSLKRIRREEACFFFVFFIDGEKPGLCMQIQSIVKAGHY